VTANLPKAALVTGAGRRIGRAIALDLAAHGWAVAVHYHTAAAEAQVAVAEIAEAGGQAVALAANLRSDSEVGALLPRAAKALGPIGCLINNAAMFENDFVTSTTRESWDAHLEVNLRAPFVLTQALAAALPATAAGCVVNMLDQRVWNLTPYFVSYTVSKSALWTLTQSCALALAPRIRVNGIGPGPTLPSPRQSAAQFGRQCALMPLGRGTTPQEICEAVRFILNAPAMTGQMIALDGGQHLGWAQPPEKSLPEE
jgi:NAD(P)-dependent dehydrogenase (short-subunit alcohol dehydrogenase family)